jgi:hypothetical protein
MKNQAKILQKSQKRKMIHTTMRRDSCTKTSYSENILPLFGGLEESLTFSPLLSYTMKHTHTSQKANIAKGWERDG